MKKFKICVYAIAKDEEKNVEQWYNSMKEADAVYVLDTGSSDNTVSKLKELGAIVEQKIINPWRFDVARNESLKLVPEDTDIYVCTDLDETISPGWRKELEEIWEEGTNQALYEYIYTKNSSGVPTLTFQFDKIHNKDYEWECSIHEVLKYTGPGKRKTVKLPNVKFTHHRDLTKDRSIYKKLLVECADERPNDARTARLLIREYVKYKEWENVIKATEKYFKIERKCLKVYDATAKRYMGRAYKNLKKYDEARKCYQEAIELAKEYRDPYLELAFLEKELYNYDTAIELIKQALTIKEKDLRIVPETFSWSERPYKELAELYKNKGKFKEAYENILLAEKINSKNKDIQKLKKDIKEILALNGELE